MTQIDIATSKFQEKIELKMRNIYDFVRLGLSFF